MLSIQYILEDHGWAKCAVSDKDNSINITASYLSDALRSLSNAVLDILQKKPVAKASFDEEPGEYRWIFTLEGDKVRIEILFFEELWGGKEDSEGKAVFKTEVTLNELKRSMIECLDNILKENTPEEYKKKWVEHDFPMDTYEQLKSLGEIA